ncbi:MAG: tetratricopeptide repeat protein [Candidatus Pacebacteria bacterium]|nr:tetratricopeptide repeat protein [Candidatus Paceibacterota bacterium]
MRKKIINEEETSVLSQEDTAVSQINTEPSVSVEEKSFFSFTSVKWESVSKYALMALAFLLPFWFSSAGVFTLSVSKSLLIFSLVLVSAVFYLIHVLQEGSIIYPKNILFLALCGVLAATLVSSFFSGIFSVSFFGYGGEINTFSFLLAASVALFLVSSIFKTEKDALIFLFLFVFSSVIVFASQVVRFFSGMDFFGVLPDKTSSLVGSWNEFSVFSGFAALLAVLFLEFFKDKMARMNSGKVWFCFLYAILGFSFISLFFVNFGQTWVVLAVFLLTLFVYLFSISFRQKKGFAALPIILFLVCLFLILARTTLVSDVVSKVGLSYIEIRPSWSATLKVSEDVMSSGVKNLILGSGPNTFSYDWLKFKPLDVNQTMFWNLNFQNSTGFIPTFAAAGGILGILSWAVFLVLFIYYGLKSVNYSMGDSGSRIVFICFLAAAYLWVFCLTYIPGPVILMMTFLVTGLFLAMFARNSENVLKKFVFADGGSIAFVSAMLVVLFLIAGVASFYLLYQKYWSIYSYGKGVNVFNSSGDLDEAQRLIAVATRFDSQDRYYRTLSEINLARLGVIINQALTPEEGRIQFQNNLASAIQNAQTAIDIDSENPSNWMSLGRVYGSILPFQIPGSKDFAIDSYKKAAQKAPTDPQPFLALAQVEIDSGGSFGSARGYLASSLRLKANYTPALYLLARVAAQEGNIDEAITQTQTALLTSPNDVGILFQLGLLQYQKKDYENAVISLERVVSLSPNYANAMYFLGLSYEKTDRIQDAITQFKKISELNPDNEEVKTILSNLRSGKPALSEVSPPAPAPEEREKPPLKEE